MIRSAVIAFPLFQSLPAPQSTDLHRYLYTQIFYESIYTIFSCDMSTGRWEKGTYNKKNTHKSRISLTFQREYA